MPFISRDSRGHIDAIYNQSSANAKEKLQANDPEIIAFLAESDSSIPSDAPIEDIYNLRLSDLGMIRVLEDLIEVLFDKDILAISDLPKIAIDRLKSRRKMRKKLEPYAHQLDAGNKDTNVLNPRTWLDDDQ